MSSPRSSRSSSPQPRCSVPGCPAPAEPGAPIALCGGHLDVAHDWIARDFGTTDVLPSPCALCGSRVGVHLPSGWVCAACEWCVGDFPDDELPPPRIDVVYYIRFDDRIKIGTTANPRQRLSRLWHDRLLAFERGDRMLERRHHGQFAAQRFARTEWFAVDDDLLRHVDAVAAGHDEPWALHARWVSEALALRT